MPPADRTPRPPPGRDAAPRRRPQRPGAAAALLVLALAVGTPGQGLTAQNPETVDSGTLEWRHEGRTVGTETFEIRTTTREIRAVGRLSLDSDVAGLTPLEVWLEADADYAPGRFRLQPSAGDVRTVTALREEERLRLQTSSRDGDRWKEFVASPGLVLVEPGVAHHWLLILRHHRESLREDGTVEVPAVVPSEARRSSLVLRREGPDRVEVPGANGTAVRYSAVLGDGPEIRIWTAEEGEVLKIEIPSRNLTAVRLPGS